MNKQQKKITNGNRLYVEVSNMRIKMLINLADTESFHYLNVQKNARTFYSFGHLALWI